ncbi:MAG: hypothetical protein ACJAQZ_002443 [Planctomycetota bacterium]
MVANFMHGRAITWSGCSIRNIDRTLLIGDQDRNALRLAATPMVDAAVDNYAEQPRAKERVALEAPELAEKQGEALLNNVHRIRMVAGNPERNGINAFAVALKQDLKSLFKAIATGVPAGSYEFGIRVAQEFHSIWTILPGSQVPLRAPLFA